MSNDSIENLMKLLLFSLCVLCAWLSTVEGLAQSPPKPKTFTTRARDDHHLRDKVKAHNERRTAHIQQRNTEDALSLKAHYDRKKGAEEKQKAAKEKARFLSEKALSERNSFGSTSAKIRETKQRFGSSQSGSKWKSFDASNSNAGTGYQSSLRRHNQRK
mgnify:CR=1 FL=1